MGGNVKNAKERGGRINGTVEIRICPLGINGCFAPRSVVLLSHIIAGC